MYQALGDIVYGYHLSDSPEPVHGRYREDTRVIEEETKAQRGKVMGQGHTASTWQSWEPHSDPWDRRAPGPAPEHFPLTPLGDIHPAHTEAENTSLGLVGGLYRYAQAGA